MKRILVIIVLVLSFICEGQTKREDYYKDIDYKDIVQIKGLFYLKADTSLVDGRVIRYNKKNEAKRYVLVVNGKPQSVDWVTFQDGYVPVPEIGINIGAPIKDMYAEGITSNRGPIAIKKKQEGFLKEKQEGLWEEYHENGKLKSKVNYTNGMKNSLYEEYYYNGQLEIKVNYINGKKDGLWLEYYENGQLWSKGNYIMGSKTGKWLYFDDKGELLGMENYD